MVVLVAWNLVGRLVGEYCMNLEGVQLDDPVAHCKGPGLVQLFPDVV